MKQKFLTTLLVIFFLVTIVGCGGYYGGHYMVKDPSTGNIYYTDSIDKIKGGALKFKDAKTKTIVTVQSSEVKKISKRDYESALEAKEAPETKEVK